jgi:hypothetical protein
MQESIKVEDLLKCHPDYDPCALELHRALYDGKLFDKALKKLHLRPRELDKSGGGAYLEARLKCADYTPHCAGIVDYLCSAALQAPPVITADQSEDGAYYIALNDSIDGRGTNLSQFARMLLLEVLQHNAAFVAVQFPAPNGLEYPSLADQKAAGQLNASLRLLPSRSVEDWDYADGVLQWVRVHTVRYVRADPVKPPDTEEHCWTFFTPTECRSYKATKQIGRAWTSDAIAALSETRTHTLGVCPVVPVSAGGIHVMGRLEQPALALWNREASQTFALDSTAYSLLYLKTNREVSQIMGGELAGVKLETGEDIGFASPNPAMFQALDADIERKQQSLFGVITALALQAQTKADNPRQSAKAKVMDYGALSILIASFANAVGDGLKSALRMIQKVRGDSVPIDVGGLDKYDVWSPESKLAIVQGALSMPLPESAKRFLLENFALTICSDAPPETQSKIRTEVASVQLTPPAPTKPVLAVKRDDKNQISSIEAA